MNAPTKRFVAGLRGFVAEISYEVLLYIALFASFVAWWHFSSIYAGIAVFIAIGVIFGGVVYWLIEDTNDKKSKSSPLPLVIILVVVASGSLAALVWRYSSSIQAAIVVVVIGVILTVLVYKLVGNMKNKDTRRSKE